MLVSADKLPDPKEYCYLDQMASDFYLLEDTARSFRSAIPAIEQWTAKLASEFSDYFLSAIGGELRYAAHYIHPQDLPKIWGIGTLWKNFVVPNSRYSRNVAWAAWNKFLADKNPVRYVELAKQIFAEGEWSNSNYGGKAWAHITQTWLDHYENRLNSKNPNRLFVDRAFDLHHNSGSALNKKWQEGYIDDVLETHAGKTGTIEDLTKWSSPSVRYLWNFSSRRWQSPQEREGGLIEGLNHYTPGSLYHPGD